MIPIIALAVVQISTADKFCQEIGKAIRGIKEGYWGYELTEDGHAQKVVNVVKDKWNLARVFIDNQPYIDTFASPNGIRVVLYTNRQYFERGVTPLPPGVTDSPLQPLEEGSFDFRFQAPQGFVFRANPDFSDTRVTTAKDEETLTGRAVKKNGSALDFALTRDKVTKFPTRLTFKKAGQETVIRFHCGVRPIKESELTIDPASYKGFEKVDPPPDSMARE